MVTVIPPVQINGHGYTTGTDKCNGYTTGTDKCNFVPVLNGTYNVKVYGTM
jgi:hypothetical protein